ncbi:hypothetical protein SAM23877_6076 [Streptomyces ambofaciens ATCC 23877]|uniref:Uncharacterized protein n=1 Tax=Streptomyces ambofaciens (strain ATCC 23877 / 3486 / DSM 40053 / JCM 4204 / NBRC 12836 / NRRL B-2516) TaxID=278992 RepID=A0A0K2B1V6_STRA7|nr:hypothetical protein SAM23877_6076 [Streptomyces ambofaciens ATCC 23877]
MPKCLSETALDTLAPSPLCYGAFPARCPPRLCTPL